ncbi:MAG: GGDEF domain-containing protein, partial [Alphaproteobacteria bacterium]
MSGVLLVADHCPQAGLSAAKTYVLRSHAAQIATCLDREDLKHRAIAVEMSRKNETQRLRLLESVVVHANDAILITKAEPIDLPGPQIVYCNEAFTRTTGYTEAEVLGRTPRILQSINTDRKALDRLRAALSAWKPIEVELLNTRKDGTEFWVELSIAPVANEKGWFTHWVSVQRDVSDRKVLEETATRARIVEAQNVSLEAEILERKDVEATLLYTASHDDLTKLHNRPFFIERLRLSIQRTQIDPDYHCAVMFMDLDRFKLVNDSLGHRAGDLLLMEISARLRSCIRFKDTLARVGGDEFALLIEGADALSFAIV